MLHHVGLEVAPANLDRSVEFWQALSFAEVAPPATPTELIEAFSGL